MTFRRALERLAIATGALAVLAIAARLVPYANDDTYIYFNYARNFVEGRPFAYDPRNIPSEGFTSALYLLLLIPFEAVGANMMFAAVLLNLIATALTLYLGYRLIRANGLLDGPFVWVGVALFGLFLARDPNIPAIVGRGLETMWGPASVLWALLHGARIHREANDTERLEALNLFFVAAFAAFLIRPENLALLGAVGSLILVAMWQRGQLAAALVRLSAFTGLMIAYFAGKLLFFGDAFPTGYYRKIHADGSGLAYVAGALAHYQSWLVALVMLGAASIGLQYWRQRDHGWSAVHRLPAVSSLLPITIACLGTLVLFLPTEPLIGFAFRYLVNFFVFLYLLVAIGISHLLSELIDRRNLHFAHGVSVVLVVGAAFWTSSLALANKEPSQLFAQWNLYKRAEESTTSHLYIRLGEFLRRRIPATEEITFVFGDAGVFPYSMRSRFIDANGLTEPYLARLFAEPNGPEKAKRFSDYILSWQPDVIVLAFGRADENGRWRSVPNEHSPFRGPTPISVFKDYRDFGIGYVCTVRGYYDLHFGVRRTSRHFEVIAEALLEYCEGNGLVLARGLTVTLDTEEVHFPRLTP